MSNFQGEGKIALCLEIYLISVNQPCNRYRLVLHPPLKIHPVPPGWVMGPIDGFKQQVAQKQRRKKIGFQSMMGGELLLLGILILQRIKSQNLLSAMAPPLHEFQLCPRQKPGPSGPEAEQSGTGIASRFISENLAMTFQCNVTQVFRVVKASLDRPTYTISSRKQAIKSLAGFMKEFWDLNLRNSEQCAGFRRIYSQ